MTPREFDWQCFHFIIITDCPSQNLEPEFNLDSTSSIRARGNTSASISLSSGSHHDTDTASTEGRATLRRIDSHLTPTSFTLCRRGKRSPLPPALPSTRELLHIIRQVTPGKAATSNRRLTSPHRFTSSQLTAGRMLHDRHTIDVFAHFCNTDVQLCHAQNFRSVTISINKNSVSGDVGFVEKTNEISLHFPPIEDPSASFT